MAGVLASTLPPGAGRSLSRRPRCFSVLWPLVFSDETVLGPSVCKVLPTLRWPHGDLLRRHPEGRVRGQGLGATEGSGPAGM